MAYVLTDNAKLGQLKAGLQAAKNYADTGVADAKSYTDTEINTAKAYTDTEVAGAKTYTDNKIAALPTERFLDNANTALVPSFTFNASTYPGATDPNLNGQPVLVLALKSIDHTNNDAETITYQFISVNALITNKADRVASPTAGNILTVDANGNPVDSGVKFATDEEAAEMIAEVFTVSTGSGE